MGRPRPSTLGESEAPMNADICKTCAHCGQDFWWTVQEQGDFAKRRLRTPKRCPDCRPAQRKPPAQQADALVRREPSSMAMTFPDLQKLLVADDIKQLLAEATAPIEDRFPTLWEWWNDIDIRQEQLANKIRAGRTANVLAAQRVALMESANKMVAMAINQRRQALEAELAELKLKEEIAERHALRDLRLQTQRAIEEAKHRKLLEPPKTPIPVRDRVLDEHRLDRQAQVRAADEMLRDFLSEVRLACESRASIHERALRIRNLLSVFEMDEESLPADARWILTTAERLRDAS